MQTCEEVMRSLPWVLDDDVDGVTLDGLESHVVGCASCRAILEREVHLRQTVRRSMESLSASASLRGKIQGLVAAERRARHPAMQAWPALAAAAVLVAFVWQGATGSDSDNEFELIVQRHARAEPAAVTARDARSVHKYLHGRVALPLPVYDPSRTGQGTARAPFEPVEVSGGITHFFNREAVHMTYELPGGEHFSLFVLESPESAGVVESTPRAIDVKTVRGFNVARWKKAGVGYYVVSELSTDRLVPILNAMRR